MHGRCHERPLTRATRKSARRTKEGRATLTRALRVEAQTRDDQHELAAAATRETRGWISTRRSGREGARRWTSAGQELRRSSASIPIPCSATHTRFFVPLVLCFLLLGAGCAELQAVDWQNVLEASAPLSEDTAAAGLKEALAVGTERAASTLSRAGGFSANQALRLSLPDELNGLARTLRSVGFGAQVDELEAAMNRAAERAAGEAVAVFAGAIREITLQDALGILRGPDDAATQYFRNATSAALRTRFAPVVEGAMAEVGVYDAYGELVTRYDAIPFAVKPKAPRLEDTVVDGALAGLWRTLAEEEARIREDPAARTTALLRRVFSEQDAPSQSSARSRKTRSTWSTWSFSGGKQDSH
jgi:hypothetical protein